MRWFWTRIAIADRAYQNLHCLRDIAVAHSVNRVSVFSGKRFGARTVFFHALTIGPLLVCVSPGKIQ